MPEITNLEQALELLGELLQERDLEFDLVVIGGGALLLQDLGVRPTEDLDVVARIEDERWEPAKPFPLELTQCVRDVAEALDLAREPRDSKDWLNPGPSLLLKLGLPPGLQDRVSTRRYGTLTIRIASRQDRIFLKLWAATDSRRGARRRVDVQDLKNLSASREELIQAARWCQAKDGRDDFIEVDVLPVLRELGLNVRMDDV